MKGARITRDLLAERIVAFEHRPRDAAGLTRAAVALLVAERQGEPVVLLTRRAARMSNHAGQWALPGGRIDTGETVEVAALRETAEEIGLALAPGAVLGRLDDYPTRSGYLISPLVVWAGTDPVLRANPAEVASIHPIPLAVFDRPGAVEFETIPESDRPVIRLWIDETTSIHAPTAAVLWQFTEIALHGRATRVDHLEQPVFAWR